MYTDIVDLLFLRGKPIEQYRYPIWQLIILVIGLGVIEGLIDGWQDHNLAKALLTSIPSELAGTVISTLFFTWWIKRIRQWHLHQSLFPIIVLSSTASSIPTTLAGFLMAGTWGAYTLPSLSPFSIGLALLLLLYSIAVFLEGLHRGTSASRTYLAKGFILLAVGLVVLFSAVIAVFNN